MISVYCAVLSKNVVVKLLQAPYYTKCFSLDVTDL